MLLVTASLAACSSDPPSDGEPTCEGDACDAEDPLTLPCSVVVDKSGRGFLPASIQDDTLIKLVYSDAAGGCPVDAKGIIELLKKNDKECIGAGRLATRAISEQAQLAASPEGASYRMVTNASCIGKGEFSILISMFGFSQTPQGAAAGLDPAGNKLPGGVEIIAFDDTDGVFNYYKEVGGKLGFFGTSQDFVSQGPGGPNLTSTRGCANCHTGGGLIMKELQAPWLHWEAGTFTPGVPELISNRESLLGRRSDGIELEGVVRSGNDRWNRTRVDKILASGTLTDLLRPMFCPVEINLMEGSIAGVPNAFFLDQSLGFPFLSHTPEDHAALLTAIGSNVPGTDKPDTVIPFTFPERSAADISFGNELFNRQIIDNTIIQDIAAVDFTRPVLSDDRCDLVEVVSSIKAKDATTPDAIRKAFIDALDGAAAGTPQAQLLAHFKASAAGKPIDHTVAATAYTTACVARATTEKISVGGAQVNALLADELKLRSLQRKMIYFDGVLDDANGSAQHPFKVLEFGATMATDKVVPTTSAQPADLLKIHPDARFSPIDCKLVDQFVPVPVP